MRLNLAAIAKSVIIFASGQNYNFVILIFLNGTSYLPKRKFPSKELQFFVSN